MRGSGRRTQARAADGVKRVARVGPALTTQRHIVGCESFKRGGGYWRFESSRKLFKVVVGCAGRGERPTRGIEIGRLRSYDVH